MPKKPKLLTLGCEKRTLTEFIDKLVDEKVDILVDVREYAWSHRPEFRKARLRDELEAAGITYIHVKSLGNPKQIRQSHGNTDDILDAYREHLVDSEEALESFSEFLRTELKQRHNICLVCDERDHGACHRSVVVDVLNGSLKKWDISHL